MKKPTAKSAVAKTPASVVKTAPVAKPAVKKAASAEKKPVVKAVAKAAATKAPAAAKPAKVAKIAKAKPAAAKASAATTTIVAAIDVGFGNHLTLRGEGPGLSWDVGVPLECSADDRWAITLPETGHPIICKFLINDQTWCAGEDYTVLPGSSVVLSPTF